MRRKTGITSRARHEGHAVQVIRLSRVCVILSSFGHFRFASTRLRARNPADWLGLVATIGQWLANPGPVRTRKLRKVLDAHPVYTGSTAIGLHPLPCPLRVHGVQNPRHQIVVQGWLRVATPVIGSPGRVHGRCRVAHGSSFSSRVRLLLTSSHAIFRGLPSCFANDQPPDTNEHGIETRH